MLGFEPRGGEAAAQLTAAAALASASIFHMTLSPPSPGWVLCCMILLNTLGGR